MKGLSDCLMRWLQRESQNHYGTLAFDASQLWGDATFSVGAEPAPRRFATQYTSKSRCRRPPVPSLAGRSIRRQYKSDHNNLHYSPEGGPAPQCPPEEPGP